jgi:hypothetical protein
MLTGVATRSKRVASEQRWTFRIKPVTLLLSHADLLGEGGFLRGLKGMIKI